jgi:nuclear-control-of-ATPase protein 2
MPIRLTRQECQLKRAELLKIRDDKAENLGGLVEARDSFAAALDGKISMRAFALEVLQRVSPKEGVFSSDSTQIIPTLQLLSSSLSSLPLLYRKLLEKRDLSRPSRLTLAWPRIFILPPLFYFGIKALYTHCATFVQALRDVKETMIGFITGWLVEPLKDVARTVRAGSEDGVIIQKEAVTADLNVCLF